MDTVLFKLPVPSTALLRGPKFEMGRGRKCRLKYVYEFNQTSELIEDTLEFDAVESFKVTYYTGNSLEVFQAYDKLLEMRKSEWLDEIRLNLQSSKSDTDGLKHFRIYFDDGPCFEFIARRIEVVTGPAPLI